MIISSVLSGLVGAFIGSSFSLIIWHLERKREWNRSRIIAFSVIEKVLTMIKQRNILKDSQMQIYYSICDDIGCLENFEKALSEIRVHSFCLPVKLINSIKELEQMISELIENYNLNYGNDDYSLLDDCSRSGIEISKTINHIKMNLSEEYKKLAKPFWFFKT